MQALIKQPVLIWTILPLPLSCLSLLNNRQNPGRLSANPCMCSLMPLWAIFRLKWLKSNLSLMWHRSSASRFQVFCGHRNPIFSISHYYMWSWIRYVSNLRLCVMNENDLIGIHVAFCLFTCTELHRFHPARCSDHLCYLPSYVIYWLVVRLKGKTLSLNFKF